MLDDLRPYPEYKDSGVPWLGAVPAHWQTKRAKYLYREVDERSVTGDEELLSVSHLTGVTPRRQKNVTMFMAESYAGSKLCQPSDLVVNTLWAWMAALGVSRYSGIVSPAYGVYRPLAADSLEPRYADYLLRTQMYAAEYTRRSTGVRASRLRLYPEDFLRIPILTPPPDEQRRIVRFLDAHGQKVAAFIRNRRRLIELLKEQKQASITSAVTGGLRSDTDFKQSGVEWLGNVPADWTLRRFKFLGRVSSGQVDPRDVRYRDLVLIAPNHIESGTGRLVYEESANEQGASSGKYLVKKGQIVYSKIRPNLRKMTIAPNDCLCSADMYPIDPVESEIRSEFLVLLMLSNPFTRYVVDCSSRVAMPKVNREALGDCWLWYPGLPEQDEILSRLRGQLRSIDDALVRAQHEVRLIREHLTRLVSDLVTGRVDVRHLAPEQVDADIESIAALGEGDDDLDEADDLDGATAGDDQDI